jgi:methyl-accepting chemotaxis protein
MAAKNPCCPIWQREAVMNRVISNLKLLHKLTIPAVFIILAGVATMISAERWLVQIERNSIVVDQDAIRLEQALIAVSDLNAATVLQRDVRLAATLEETEEKVATYKKYLNDVQKALDDLAATAVAPEQRHLADDSVVAYREFMKATLETVASKLDSFKTHAAASTGGGARTWRAKLDEMLDKMVELSKADMSRAKQDTIAVGQHSALVLALVSGIALLVALGLLAWIAVVQVSRPLNQITGLMGRLAAGDLAVEVSAAERQDEVGALGRALTIFKENAISARDFEAAERVERQGREARAVAIETYIGKFEKSVETALGSFTAASARIRTSSGNIATIAETTGGQSATVMAASEQAAMNVQTVAAASEELSASISEISSQVANSAGVAGSAVREIEATDATVQSLSEAAVRIGEVVRLISDIASQTNLLALNATIEAARAGDAGKGFAVVATEVKALATQTARATDEIAGQITDIRSATAKVVAAIGAIGGTINRVSEISSSIASAVEEQSAATQEISRNTQEAASNTAQVQENIAGLNRLTGESRAAAAEELVSAEEIGRQAELLGNEIHGFLSQIRAA